MRRSLARSKEWVRSYSQLPGLYLIEPISLTILRMETTRIAPSPTGALHLGNARTFLVNWALARQQDWKIVMRIEDLDGPRIKQGAEQRVLESLAWLGLDYDSGPYYQANDLTPYHAALNDLAAAGKIYPCRCTRSQILAASLSAPHGDEHEICYPGTCRPAADSMPKSYEPGEAGTAWRYVVPPGSTEFHDQFVGPQTFDVSRTVGDFLVSTKQGLPSYQLAVVVDDARQGITQVVRGDDLLSSAARQKLLYEALDLGPQPQQLHLPLVLGDDGRRLAKRHGDSRLEYYRQRGVSAERVVGLLAQWCGVGTLQKMTTYEFAEQFAVSKLPAEPVVFTKAHDSWLLGLLE